jgi:hypothetical protein
VGRRVFNPSSCDAIGLVVEPARSQPPLESQRRNLVVPADTNEKVGATSRSPQRV